jgi:hypothetical protein
MDKRLVRIALMVVGLALALKFDSHHEQGTTGPLPQLARMNVVD